MEEHKHRVPLHERIKGLSKEEKELIEDLKKTFKVDKIKYAFYDAHGYHEAVVGSPLKSAHGPLEYLIQKEGLFAHFYQPPASYSLDLGIKGKHYVEEGNRVLRIIYNKKAKLPDLSEFREKYPKVVIELEEWKK